jgi:hypothetical protein
MADIAAVQANQPDSNAGKPKPKSEVSFPYFSLDKSIEVAKLIHDRAGGRCGRPQLASLLSYSGIKNGGFLTRVSAARMFGLVDMIGDSVVLTDRAKKILSPVRPSDSAQAKLDAFMSVELFRRVHDDFEGHSLPHDVGLKNKFLIEYKIVSKQVDTALRTLLESAQSAGLFELHGNRSRMIKPIIADSGRHERSAAASPDEAAAAKVPPQDTQAEGATGNGGNGGNGGGGSGGGNGGSDPPTVHPALMGLIQTLPAIGAKLGPKRRTALIDAFKSTINFIYPEDEEAPPLS